MTIESIHKHVIIFDECEIMIVNKLKNVKFNWWGIN